LNPYLDTLLPRNYEERALGEVFQGVFVVSGGASFMAEPRNGRPPGQPDPELGKISDRLKDLGSRIAAERTERVEAEKPKPSFATGATDFSKGYKLASEFVAGVLVGAAVGYGLDYAFGTLPLFLVVFLLLGFGAGLLNMSRAANRSNPTPEELARMKPLPADDEED
jgi:ATP synthase protein I